MHSLLSLTVHFLDAKFEPKYFVLDARPIDGPHTAENYVKMLNDMLDMFEIDVDKVVNSIYKQKKKRNVQVHVFMRDAQSTMKKATRLMNVMNFDCLAHKTQLVVQIL